MGSKKLTIYLAGKLDPELRDHLHKHFGEEVIFLDPVLKPESPSIGDFVAWDLNAVQRSDAVIVIDSPDAGKGTAAEMGVAWADNIPIISLVRGKFVHPFIAYMSRIVVNNMETLLLFLESYLEDGDWIKAYYKIYDE